MSKELAGMETILNVEADLLVGAVLLFVALLFVLWISNAIRISRMKKRYKKMMGESGMPNLEVLMTEIQEEVHKLRLENEQQRNKVNVMERKLKSMKGHVGVHRYNAFADRGSDLSFSVAIVDDELNGVVLSGLHSREDTYVYSKPLTNGDSAYPLTPEEKQAINQAIHKA
ncbi:hypothetical protein SY83_06755 [Paenibacillus swuensis]|uniref:DUF4446 domain-containing protein n=1 Tax=Paenibacillus swuensis TaxID=1178515 RepID=A0A172TG44_9BACL|nr:DUF4446 family protein [Paenibacillus swuensis]ANE46035.1 hypothetical protein SY83_06755 [Paenibacillus swuensis]